jgi:hypothetical protein
VQYPRVRFLPNDQFMKVLHECPPIYRTEN